MKTMRVLCLLSVTLWGSQAWAQALTPGLWENVGTMKDTSAEGAARMAKMQEELTKMPADQRKMMDQMMAKKGGGDAMGMLAGKPTTTRICITPEQAARAHTPDFGERCKTGGIQRSGKTVRSTFTCTGEDASTGETEFTMASDKAYSGRIVINSVRQGQPGRMEITQNARWLAADCGDVKPRPQTPPGAPGAAGATTAPRAKP
jgi:hypothetical protein